MKTSARVVLKEKLKERIGILKLEPEESLEFTPGQFCNLTLEKNGEALMRPFSMTSSPEEVHVEFYLKAYPNGEVAKHILALEEGDEIRISGPFGNFSLLGSQDQISFVCAGSGVAPLMGMVRHLERSESGKEIQFLHGASHPDELGYYKELKSLAEKDNFTYMPTVSRHKNNPDWQGRRGRVEEHLHLLDNKEAEVYVCGPPPMVDNVVAELEKKGYNKVYTERYY